MSEIKTIADKLRQLSSVPIAADNLLEDAKGSSKSKVKASESPKTSKPVSKPNPNANGSSDNGAEEILNLIRSFDNVDGSKQLHVRLDDSTFFMLNQLKAATGIGMRQFIAFAVNYIFQNHGELKSVIRDSLKRLEL